MEHQTPSPTPNLETTADTAPAEMAHNQPQKTPAAKEKKLEAWIKLLLLGAVGLVVVGLVLQRFYAVM